ncbi:hypothetical protein FD09_GL003143 [Schleiferilactobacillus perolens DSM 12744]|uniref:Uncharacterized protein n=1 Tax=Schleiferilactobacillus perolens DSM 12744 TaxID=1423792 RepID=A0A0R1MW82_9LACO|nr:hypothetical protein FD09_GL003143 [Schleiferilactobacillus perolens DSM 12744]
MLVTLLLTYFGITTQLNHQLIAAQDTASANLLLLTALRQRGNSSLQLDGDCYSANWQDHRVTLISPNDGVCWQWE